MNNRCFCVLRDWIYCMIYVMVSVYVFCYHINFMFRMYCMFKDFSDYWALCKDTSPAGLTPYRSVTRIMLWNIGCQPCRARSTQPQPQHQHIPLCIPPDNKVKEQQHNKNCYVNNFLFCDSVEIIDLMGFAPFLAI